MADLLTFGESMLRLSPPDSERIEQVGSLESYVAGAESNVAIAAHRLGLDAAWTSKLPDTALGRTVRARIAEHGVDVDVAWTDEGRQGLYFVEQAPEPRGTNVIYDRDEAAVRTATPDELAVDRIGDARYFFTTGITPALSETLAETTKRLLERATEAGTRTVFDVNYRANLWSRKRARDVLSELLPLVDTLVIAQRDAELVFERTREPLKRASWFVSEFDIDTVVLTRGADGALALHDDQVHERDAFDVDTVDPIGSGDAFVGGYLASRAADESISESLTYGTATAALKRTVPGDVARVSADEVDRLIERGSATGVR